MTIWVCVAIWRLYSIVFNFNTEKSFTKSTFFTFNLNSFRNFEYLTPYDHTQISSTENASLKSRQSFFKYFLTNSEFSYLLMVSGSFEFECSCFEGAILNAGSKKCEIAQIDPCTALGCSEDKKCRYDFMGNPSCLCKNVKLDWIKNSL